MGSRVSRTLTVVALMALVAVGGTPAQAAFPGHNGKLAYAVERGGDFEIFSVNPNGTGETPLTDDPADDTNPAWSPDGTKIAFSSDRVGSFADVWVMDADGTNPVRLTNVQSRGVTPAWSPDGSQLVFASLLFDGWELWRVDADGTDPVKLLDKSASATTPSWAPNGAAITLGYHAFSSSNPDITAISPSGSTLWSYPDACFSSGPDWAPDASRLVYDADNRMVMIDGDGTNPSDPDCVTRQGDGHIGDAPVWSPDGTTIAYVRRVAADPVSIQLTDTDFTDDPDGVNDQEVIETGTPVHGLDWQPIPVNGYPRPKGATPFQVSLVPAYKPCVAPNRTHGPPLAFPACHPPAQQVSSLTVGTADANGKPAKSVSFMRFDALVGNPATAADEADVQVTASITDVYAQPSLGDYVGDVQGRLALRVTDKLNLPHPGGPGPGTMDVSILFPIACAATTDTTVGATCRVTTTVDALSPGAVPEGRRSIWQLGQVTVEEYDGPPFMRQGIFIP